MKFERNHLPELKPNGADRGRHFESSESAAMKITTIEQRISLQYLVGDQTKA